MIHCRVLLPHPLEPRILMMKSHGEWRLPVWADSAAHPWYEVQHVNRAVAARFGIETTVLRCISDRIDPVTGDNTRIYELENHSALHDAVPGATWLGERELDLLHVPDPETRELLHGWYARERGEDAFTGPAWFRRGWFIETLAWTVAQLRELGVTTRDRPEQLRASERSFVMRLRSDDGVFFFRAAPLGFEHVPLVTDWLAHAFPLNIPQTVATDAARGWRLMREAGTSGTPLGEEREPEEWYRAVRRMAEIQIESAHHTRELRGLGCPARGLDVLAHRIPALCADAAAMLLGKPCGLSRREIQRVRTLVPTLLTLCEELASFDLPDCIDYGELRAGSVFSTLHEPVYLDWTDAAVGHPFFGVAHLSADAISMLPASSSEAQRRLRDSYLAPWRNVAPLQSLARAFEIARRLAPVHRAATLHAELIPAATQPWECECDIPRHLRAALRLITDSDAIA